MGPNQPNTTPPVQQDTPSPPTNPAQSQTTIVTQPATEGFNKKLLLIPLFFVAIVVIGFSAFYFYNPTKIKENPATTKVEILTSDAATTPQGYPIEVGSLRFSAPWTDFQSITERDVSKKFLFANNKSITVIQPVSNNLLTKSDLSLSAEQFAEKYKLSSPDIDLQAYILNNTEPQNIPTIRVTDEKSRLQMLRSLFFPLPNTIYSVVKTRQTTIIKSYSQSLSKLEVQDSKGNIYTMLIGSDLLKEEEVDVIINSIMLI